MWRLTLSKLKSSSPNEAIQPRLEKGGHMAAINEKRVNWRKVAKERGDEINTLRSQILNLEREIVRLREQNPTPLPECWVE